MNKTIRNLFELQSLEFEDKISPEAQKRIDYLRARIPKPILAHYDRFCDRGKQGVAILRHQVCTSCHMQVPLATVLDAMRGDDVSLCGNCGRYLYFQEEAPEAIAPAAKKTPAKSRSKELAHAV